MCLIKLKKSIILPLIYLVLIFEFSWIAIPLNPAFGFKKNETHPVPFYPLPGLEAKGPLKGHRPIHFANATYLFLDGIFYRSSPLGFVVAAAPIGAVVPILPPAAAVIPFGTQNYYTYADVYYRKVPGGYRVIRPPANPSQDDENVGWEGDEISVAVQALNVRSGPGTEYKVIKEILRGDILIIQSTRSGWYYVRLQDNTYGWVMGKYTTLSKSKALGQK